MSAATHSDPDAGLEPAFVAPKGACDAHFHVFGPAERYPLTTTDLRYPPPLAPLEDFLIVARRLALPLAFTVAHMGLFPARDGAGQPGFQDFLALANDGSKRCWVKLTGIYRFSKDPTFADIKPFAQALIAAVPDQLIWGSDYP